MSYLANVWSGYKTYQKHKKFLQSSKGNSLPSETFYKYPLNSNFGGRRVLNVGCGRSVYKASNVTNMDLVKAEGVDIAWDLSKTPLPFESNTFDFIIANHVLEHVPNWWECFKELARVLKPGGTMEVWIPPVSADSAFTYRDHINLIGLFSFFGCGTLARSGTNLFAAKESAEMKEDVKRLFITNHSFRPIITWWTILAPNCVLDWMTKHLRNVISEEGFYFEKV